MAPLTMTLGDLRHFSCLKPFCVVWWRCSRTLGLVTDRSWVQFPAGLLARNIGKLSLASFRGCLFEYLLWLGVKVGISPLPGGR